MTLPVSAYQAYFGVIATFHTVSYITGTNGVVSTLYLYTV